MFPLPFDGPKIQMLQQLTWANIFLKCPIAVILCFEPFGCFSSRPADLSSVKLRWQIFLFPLFYFFPTFNLISFVSWIFFFRSCFSDGITPLLWRFPKSWNPYNVKSFLTDISLSVAQIKKFQKTRWFYFLILLLGGPSPPSQLVPNPFNWSPNTVFYRYLCIGRSNKKK